ncbi:MAG: PIN domain-containing protein [Deltaproteobacteria bacterium]|nr:PIN domain-containing protein [Deltaproteobacteria bacterium]
MIFLLDTNAFSDLMRKHSRLEGRMASLPGADRVVICPVVRGEILYGIEQLPQSRRRQNLERQAAPLFAIIPCEPIPERAGDHYARIKTTRQQKGLTLDENDLWLAATAMALNSVLITRDSDFQRIDGLTADDWTA